MNHLKAVLLLLLATGSCLQGYAAEAARTSLSGKSNPSASAVSGQSPDAGAANAAILRDSSSFSCNDRIVLKLHDGSKVKGLFKQANADGVELFLTVGKIEMIPLGDIRSISKRGPGAGKVIGKTAEVLGRTALFGGAVLVTAVGVACDEDQLVRGGVAMGNGAFK